jgi:hypothetical protein
MSYDGGGTISSGNTSVYGANTQISQPPPDPYAAWGGRDAYNALVSGFDTQKANIYGSSRDAAGQALNSRRSSILDFITGLTSGQKALDERGIQNELAKKQGRGSILDMVGRGIQSGNVLLGSRNAGAGSAAEALARAYGQSGTRQMAGVNNQYEAGNRELGIAQDQFNTGRQTGLRKFEEDKASQASTIASQARDRLAQLDAAMLQANLPQRIAIEQEKNQIMNEVQGILGQADTQLQGANNIQAMTTQQRQAEAANLGNAGNAAANPFEFSNLIPAQFQGLGQPSTGLPLFTSPRKRTA